MVPLWLPNPVWPCCWSLLLVYMCVKILLSSKVRLHSFPHLCFQVKFNSKAFVGPQSNKNRHTHALHFKGIRNLWSILSALTVMYSNCLWQCWVAHAGIEGTCYVSKDAGWNSEHAESGITIHNKSNLMPLVSHSQCACSAHALASIQRSRLVNSLIKYNKKLSRSIES